MRVTSISGNFLEEWGVREITDHTISANIHTTVDAPSKVKLWPLIPYPDLDGEMAPPSFLVATLYLDGHKEPEARMIVHLDPNHDEYLKSSGEFTFPTFVAKGQNELNRPHTCNLEKVNETVFESTASHRYLNRKGEDGKIKVVLERAWNVGTYAPRPLVRKTTRCSIDPEGAWATFYFFYLSQGTSQPTPTKIIYHGEGRFENAGKLQMSNFPVLPQQPNPYSGKKGQNRPKGKTMLVVGVSEAKRRGSEEMRELAEGEAEEDQGCQRKKRSVRQPAHDETTRLEMWLDDMIAAKRERLPLLDLAQHSVIR
ncbi:MAG: hypothetical protein Q9219_005902 [cf. Caloplaca sp. 3 TL-2023]